MRPNTRTRLCTAVLVIVATAGITLRVAPVNAVSLVQTSVVSANPANGTPAVLDGMVTAVARIGTTVYVGGDFTQIQAASGPVIDRSYLFAFNASTGSILSWAPVLNNSVKAMQVAPNGTSLFVAGLFTTVNGQTRQRMAQIDAATGAVTSWTANANGAVNSIVVRGTTLYMAGYFTRVRGLLRSNLAAVSTATGTVSANLDISFSAPYQGTKPWIREIDVTSDGTRLAAVGNFKTVDGLDRTQLVMIDLTTSPATVADWETDRFKEACISKFITYMYDVEFSPDGSYFAIVTTGGNRATRMCDSVSRWETNASGSGIQPTWVDWSGGDSFTQVAVTGVAVYAGGHNQLVNNPYVAPDCGKCGAYYPQPGGIWREGLSALDPLNGMPYTWDPGRARGRGVFAFLATSDGLWIGSDTSRIGNEIHPRLAFMPLAGGITIAPNDPYTLPGYLYTADSTLVRRAFDGTTMGSPTTVSTSLDWSTVRGAFALKGTLYLAMDDGRLYTRSFNGTSLGAAQEIDLHGLDQAPVSDPRFVIPGTSIPIPALTDQLKDGTGLFFDNGRIYYTVAGDPRLYYRYFTPQSLSVGANIFVASGNTDGRSWSDVRGMALIDGMLYVGHQNGTLTRTPFSNGPTGAATTIGGPNVDGVNWASHAMFLFSS